MLSRLDHIPVTVLLIVAIIMFLAPFRPTPHVIEKIIMLKNDTLSRPIDIFDLFFHLIPTFLLIPKGLRHLARLSSKTHLIGLNAFITNPLISFGKK